MQDDDDFGGSGVGDEAGVEDYDEDDEAVDL